MISELLISRDRYTSSVSNDLLIVSPSSLPKTGPAHWASLTFAKDLWARSTANVPRYFPTFAIKKAVLRTTSKDNIGERGSRRERESKTRRQPRICRDFLRGTPRRSAETIYGRLHPSCNMYIYIPCTLVQKDRAIYILIYYILYIYTRIHNVIFIDIVCPYLWTCASFWQSHEKEKGGKKNSSACFFNFVRNTHASHIQRPAAIKQLIWRRLILSEVWRVTRELRSPVEDQFHLEFFFQLIRIIVKITHIF